MSEPVTFYNRLTGQLETEAIYGEKPLRWAYQNPLGKLALQTFIKRPLFSKYYGHRMSTAASKERVAPFIDKYKLDPSDFQKSPKDFTSFNDFFYRKLKPEARPIADSDFIFPADGRHLVFPEISQIKSFFVKGQHFDLAALLGSRALAEQYKNGSLLFSRLCPVDYHRYHFPASGIPSDTQLLNGPLYSVNPIALSKNLSYLWQNKRTLTKLETPNHGTLLLLEVGATCVGSIHQSYPPNQPIEKGDEKGYFAFGGSTTITIFPKDSITFAPDLLKNSAKQIETYALMGDSLTYTTSRFRSAE